MNKRTLLEINLAKKELQDKMSDDHVRIQMLNCETPKGGVYYEWMDQDYEFRYRGSMKQLKKIVKHLINKKDE
jgi:hypothetical protein